MSDDTLEILKYTIGIGFYIFGIYLFCMVEIEEAWEAFKKLWRDRKWKDFY